MQTNDVTFAGYAGRDAEDRVTQGGTRIVTFPLCHTEKDNQGQDRSTWVRVKVFGGWCDAAATVTKGQNVVVKGKLNVENYTTKEGVERTSVDIIAFAVGLLERQERPANSNASRSSGGGNRPRGGGQGGGGRQAQAAPSFEEDDSIPF